MSDEFVTEDDDHLTTFGWVISTALSPPMLESISIEVRGPTANVTKRSLTETELQKALDIYDRLWIEMRQAIVLGLGL